MPLKCKDGQCEIHNSDQCCFECADYKTCVDRCDQVPAHCGVSEEVKTGDLALFQNKAMIVMQTIVNLNQQKKILEDRDKAVRQELQKAMDEFGIKSFENDLLKVTYVEPTTRTTIDSARLKKELPAVAEKYSKTSQVKGSVRIEVK